MYNLCAFEQRSSLNSDGYIFICSQKSAKLDFFSDRQIKKKKITIVSFQLLAQVMRLSLLAYSESYADLDSKVSSPQSLTQLQQKKSWAQSDVFAKRICLFFFSTLHLLNQIN